MENLEHLMKCLVGRWGDFSSQMPIVDSLRLKGDAQLFLLGGSLVLFEERVSHLGNKLYEGEDCNWTSGG